MQVLKIKIPNMQSQHCQMRVREALQSMEGLTIQDIVPGTASILAENDLSQNMIIQAIEKAGYTVDQIASSTPSDADEEVFRFKTNINCMSCVATVTPSLDAAEGICHWDVDTKSKEKILSVHSIGISEKEIIERVKNAGYQIELIND